MGPLLVYKKKIEAQLQKYLQKPTANNVPQEYLHALAPSMSTILVFGVIDWDYRYQRPQHLSSFLARQNYRVIYINPTFIPRRASIGNTLYHVRGLRDEKVWVIELSADKNIFIYAEEPTNKDNQLIKESLNQVLLSQNTGGSKPIMIFHHPFWHFLATDEDYQAFPKFYDCMDIHSQFSVSSSQIPEWEKKMVHAVDAVTVSAEGIAEHIRLISELKHVTKIPNACDFDKLRTMTCESEGEGVGYVGEISEWFNHQILADCLKSFPDKKFKLYGECRNQHVKSLSKQYSNLKLYGEIPFEQVPHAICDSQVLIIPFEMNELTEAVDPVKLYEYLSFGKPVVATGMRELRKAHDLIYTASSAKEFVLALSRALQEHNGALAKRRKSFAERNTWRARAFELRRVIDMYT